MPLFEIPKRNISKSSDRRIVTKSQTAKIVTPTIKGGTNLMARINQIKAMVEQNLGKYRDKYMLIRDEDVLIDYMDRVLSNGYISIDTETDGLDPLRNTIAGICINTRDYKPAYIPLNHISYITGAKMSDQLPADIVLKQFQRLTDAPKRPWTDMFNAPFDIRVLRAFGLTGAYCDWDAYLATRILNENEPVNKLKPLHNKYCLGGKGDAFTFDDLFKGIPFTYIPPEFGFLYAAHDPDITTEYSDYQRRYLRPDSEREDIRNMYWVFMNIEMPCVSVVCDMEDTGVLFDKEYNLTLQDKYHKLLDEREENFRKVCDNYKDKIDAYRKKHKSDCKLDDPINIKSTDQLSILLYDILGCPLFYDKKKKKETKSTAEDALVKLDNDIAKAILDYREFSTLVSTFIDKMPECVNPDDGRIHCKFNQYGADTGRFSSQDPNLQNIPSHNKEIRKMFVASPGYVLMSSDYSQQEPKVMTQMCQDPKMIQAYQNNKDLYAEIAALSFNTTYRECLEFMTDEDGNYILDENGERITYKAGKERRSQAKSILLGVLYGRGVPSIAEQLGTTKERAQKIKDSVFKGFPAIPKFERDSLEMAEELGYVTTLWGRKRRLPDMQLPEYEFVWKDGAQPDDDLLDFSGMNEPTSVVTEVPEATQDYYYNKLINCYWKDKQKIKDRALKEGIVVIDNTMKIADAQRQCVNARIQGSAADMSKLAMIKVGNDKRLKELGFRLLIPVHDELIAECPEENAKECSERFAKLMSEAAADRLKIPIKCDVEVTKAWYGPAFNLNDIYDEHGNLKSESEWKSSERKQKESNTAREFENELVEGGN